MAKPQNTWLDRYDELRKRQTNYTENFMRHLTDIVTVMQREEANFLITSLDNLENQEQSLPTYIQAAFAELGMLEGQVRKLRFERNRIQAQVRLEIRDRYESAKQKLPAEHIFDAEVNRDIRAQQAETDLADAEERYTLVKGTVEALKAKLTLLPGLQGQRNRLMDQNPSSRSFDDDEPEDDEADDDEEEDDDDEDDED